MRYDADGQGGWRSAADFSYGYREALRDGVVRPVVFAAYTGTSRWRNSAGQVIAASLSETSTRQTEATAWRTALNPRGRWVPHVIAAMDERITQLRATGMPDAAGLVLASDQDDARAYAAIVEQVTGEAPVVIVSDDPRASDKITAFASGTARMAVCVRMVSEGVDIPRAACLAWMTSYRTPLFFAQGVGRVVRARSRTESATVFLPAVRPLLALAAELEDERSHVIPPPADQADDLLDVVVPEPAEPEPGDTAEIVDADAAFAHVLHGGRAVVAPQGADLSADDEDYLGLPGILSPEQMAEAAGPARLRCPPPRGGRRGARPQRGPPPDDPGLSPRERRWRAGAELRREVNRLVAVHAARTGMPHGQVHAQVAPGRARSRVRGGGCRGPEPSGATT